MSCDGLPAVNKACNGAVLKDGAIAKLPVGKRESAHNHELDVLERHKSYSLIVLRRLAVEVEYCNLVSDVVACHRKSYDGVQQRHRGSKHGDDRDLYKDCSVLVVDAELWTRMDIDILLDCACFGPWRFRGAAPLVIDAVDFEFTPVAEKVDSWHQRPHEH